MSPTAITILQSLMRGPKTRMQIAESSQAKYNTICAQIIVLHKAGEVYISGWSRHVRRAKFQPIFSAGLGRDVPCRLKPLSQAQIHQNFRKKLVETGEIEHYRAKKAAHERLRKIRNGKPAMWFAALPNATLTLKATPCL